MRDMFWNIIRRLLFRAPLDYQQIVRDHAETIRKIREADKKLPPVSQQIEAHFDLSKTR